MITWSTLPSGDENRFMTSRRLMEQRSKRSDRGIKIKEHPVKEDLHKVRSLARDLRNDKESPRSPRERLAGYALAARALDKCRAAIMGWQGEYLSNCPLDQRWLAFAELDYNLFRAFVATGATDSEVAGWISQHAKPRPQAEIDTWNNREGAVRLS
jgi:hypothetical protein